MSVKYSTFGYDLTRKLLLGQDWTEDYYVAFPRVTICDFKVPSPSFYFFFCLFFVFLFFCFFFLFLKIIRIVFYQMLFLYFILVFLFLFILFFFFLLLFFFSLLSLIPSSYFHSLLISSSIFLKILPILSPHWRYFYYRCVWLKVRCSYEDKNQFLLLLLSYEYS